MVDAPRPPADALERVKLMIQLNAMSSDDPLGTDAALMVLAACDVFAKMLRENLEWVLDIALSALSAPAAEPVAWQPIEQFVPRVGARAVLRLEHPNLEFAKGAERERWIDYQVGTWIDHNGGGWTWYGMLGRVTHFLPFEMPLAPITAKMEE